MKTTEKNGIIYFAQPFRIDFMEWLYTHLDCDSIIEKQTTYSNLISVLCFAKSKEFNTRLREVRRNEYPDASVLRGVDAREANSID